MPNDHERLRSLGADGIGTLLLSGLLLLASGGVSLLVPLYRVIRTARLTPSAGCEPMAVAVFGKRLRNEQPDKEFCERLERACALYRSGHAESILLLGGFTGGARLSEAAAGADYLHRKGVPLHLLHQEDRSRHTLENLAHARALLAAPTRSLLLVTNRYHLARCSTLANGFGLAHRLCAAEERLNWSAGLTLRLAGEAFYLHWYWVGKNWSRLTRNRRSLERIS